MSMLCNSLSKNNLMLSSFLNDDTKLIYKCFIVKVSTGDRCQSVRFLK
jgi:hypothetical protein